MRQTVSGPWVDDFDGPAGRPPDPAVWGHELGSDGWGCDQLQDYTDSTANAALTGDGCLAITARRSSEGHLTSARITTQGRITCRYGRVEARIRVPAGPGVWPAFWMLGTDIGEVGWPACGEIDVMEYVGSDPQAVHGTLHGPGFSGVHGGAGQALHTGVGLSDAFHRYAVEWSPERIEWFLDGRRYHRLEPEDVPGPWPFRHDFYLLLNLAIGGSWPGLSAEGVAWPATMLVDWIRIRPL